MTHHRQKMYTSYPQVDPRMPHSAPIFGAHPLGDATGDALSTDGAAPEAVPAAIIGLAASALNGAAVGGIAGESWMAAGVGASLSAALWGGWTFVGSYPLVGPKTKIALGVGATLAAVALGMALYARRKK